MSCFHQSIKFLIWDVTWVWNEISAIDLRFYDNWFWIGAFMIHTVQQYISEQNVFSLSSLSFLGISSSNDLKWNSHMTWNIFTSLSMSFWLFLFIRRILKRAGEIYIQLYTVYLSTCILRYFAIRLYRGNNLLLYLCNFPLPFIVLCSPRNFWCNTNRFQIFNSSSVTHIKMAQAVLSRKNSKQIRYECFQFSIMMILCTIISRSCCQVIVRFGNFNYMMVIRK